MPYVYGLLHVLPPLTLLFLMAIRFACHFQQDMSYTMVVSCIDSWKPEYIKKNTIPGEPLTNII